MIVGIALLMHSSGIEMRGSDDFIHGYSRPILSTIRGGDQPREAPAASAPSAAAAGRPALLFGHVGRVLARLIHERDLHALADAVLDLLRVPVRQAHAAVR